MEPITSYLALARSANATEFVAQSNAAFLLKRPGAQPILVPESNSIQFETRAATMDFDPFATEWRVAPVKKREGNPFPERISIGRAPNCDVVIRLPSISKVHAHVLIDGGHYSLADAGASNSTYVNRTKLENKVAVPLRFGDTVLLGPIKFEFVDAKGLYQILRSEVVTTKVK